MFKKVYFSIGWITIAEALIGGFIYFDSPVDIAMLTFIGASPMIYGALLMLKDKSNKK